jgi:hypothetical protein
MSTNLGLRSIPIVPLHGDVFIRPSEPASEGPGLPQAIDFAVLDLLLVCY